MRVTEILKALVVVGLGLNSVSGSVLLVRQEKQSSSRPALASTSQVSQVSLAANTVKAPAPTSPPSPIPSASSKQNLPATTNDTPAESLPPLTTSLPSPTQSSVGTHEPKVSGNATLDDPTASVTGPLDTSVPVPSGFNTGNTTVPLDPNGLPFTPAITPGMAVAGVLLLITGIPYTLVGVRYRMVHIFLSTCYLTSLSVAVLIIYVMNPPVSNALQGGYLVACVFTGLLLGGLATVFPEILESMGALLGGFCLSMWLLTLKPDGLISTVIGKVVFILCLSLLAWSPAFLSILKRGGLIFGISFGGATVIILGIDCFSRAGMKEFWLYIWALNDNIFPLGRDHFPHTRGIRVEIAAIIIITLIGIVSQSKLWRLIQERGEDWREEWRNGFRSKRRPVSSREARNERSVEPKEETSQRDTVRWEDARYSRMPSTTEIDQLNSELPSRRNSKRPLSDMVRSRDSGLGSDDARKSSVGDLNTPNRSSRNVNIPMLELDFSGSRSRQPSPAPSSRRKRNSNREGEDEIEEVAESSLSLAPGSTVITLDNHTQRSSHQSGTHTIVIPKEEDEDDRSSVATGAASVTPVSARNSKHFSIQSLGDIMKNKQDHADDNSSLAATLDRDESSEDHLPLVGSEPGSPRARRTSMLSIGHNKRSSIAESLKRTLSGRRNSANKESLSTSNSTRQGSKDEKSDFLKPFDIALPSSPSLSSPASPTLDLDDEFATDIPTIQKRPESRGLNRPAAPLRQESLKDMRPPSRLVKTFRTSEWAKHLEDAEAPAVDNMDYLESNTSAAIADNEVAAPVNFAGLQEGISAPHIRPPAPIVSRSPSRATIVIPREQSSTPLPRSPAMPRSPTSPTSPTSPSVPTLQVPADSLSPSLRQGSMSPLPSAPQAAAIRTSSRSSSTPIINEAILESPVNEMRSYRDMAPTPVPMYAGEMRSTPNLLASPPAIPTYAMNSRSTTPLPQRAPSGARRSLADDEMSRKNMPIQHSAMRPMTAQENSPRLSGSGFPSRPSTRQSAAEQQRQKAMLQQWRDSMRHDNMLGQYSVNAIEDRRTEMINERQLAAQNERQREIAAIYRDSYREDQMKQRDMQELHRQALRKMQSQVGAKASKK